MPEPVGKNLGQVRHHLSETWLEDLFWHKKMYHGARWRWWGEHVMDVVTSYTGGRLSFTTVDDLRMLHTFQQAAEDEAFVCQLAMAEHLEQAGDLLGRWRQVSEAVGLSEVECSATVWFAEVDPTRRRTNKHVERVRRVVKRQPFKNPLIEVWELKQLWGLYRAGAAMLQDTLCDLLVELRGSRPDVVLYNAVGRLSSAGLDDLIDGVHRDRGGPGDPRRLPRQVF